MKPTFDHVLEYRVSGVTSAPLRTGGAQNDPQTVLRRSDGRYFVQGAGVAGALRSWLQPQNAAVSDRLFGKASAEGQLAVSDCVFGPEAALVVRPRLRINGETGTAADKARFDTAHIETGASFALRLVWKGLGAPGAERDTLELLLAALQSGEITLGGQRSNGFGRMRLQRVYCTEYDLTCEADRTAWLNGGKKGTLLQPAAIAQRRVQFAVTMAADRLLVKSGAPDGHTDAVPLREAGMPVVPGSSLKGAFRAQLTRAAPLLGVSQAGLQAMFGTAADASDDRCAGVVSFSDAVFAAGSELPVMTRIRIDRFTGGVQRGALFTQQPVGGICTFTISLPADRPAFAALLLYALRDLGQGSFTLGSGAAIGQGRAAGLEAVITAPQGKARLQCGTDGLRIVSGEAMLHDWLKALGGRV